MGILGGALMGVGYIVSLVFGVILLIQAFRESLLWGLVYLFVPFGAIVYIVKFWDDAKDPFLKSLIGIPLIFLGAILMGVGGS